MVSLSDVRFSTFLCGFNLGQRFMFSPTKRRMVYMPTHVHNSFSVSLG